VPEELKSKCANGASSWRKGEVKYQRDLIIEWGRSAPYNVALGLDGGARIPDDVLPPGQYSSAPVIVKCGIGARLVPGDDGVRVDHPEWMVREFTPSDLVQWSWSVAGKKTGVHSLRLEIQPAVLVGDGYGIPVGSPQVSIFVTKSGVVTTGLMQTIHAWYDEDWPWFWAMVLAIFGALTILTTKVRGILKGKASNADAGGRDEAADLPR
jgi:hypothetical protein